MWPSDSSRIWRRRTGSSTPALPLAAQRGAGLLGLDQLLQLLQREAEQVLQPQQLGEPLDVWPRRRCGGRRARGRWRRAAGRSPRSSGSSAASSRPAWRRRRSAARVVRSTLMAPPRISSRIASSVASGRRAPRIARPLRWLGRSSETPAPSTEVAASTQSAVCMLAMKGSSWALVRPEASPEKILKRTGFRHRRGDDREHEGDRDHGAGVLQHRPRAGGDAAALGRHGAHHRRRVRRVEHPRADPDQGQPEPCPASRRCRPAGSSSAPGRRR